MTPDFSRPGKPTDNAFIEAFTGKLRQECPSAHWFLTLADAREKMEAWRRFCTEDRPHSAIGYKVPIALTEPGGDRPDAMTKPGLSSPGRPKVRVQRRMRAGGHSSGAKQNPAAGAAGSQVKLIAGARNHRYQHSLQFAVWNPSGGWMKSRAIALSQVELPRWRGRHAAQGALSAQKPAR